MKIKISSEELLNTFHTCWNTESINFLSQLPNEQLSNVAKTILKNKSIKTVRATRSQDASPKLNVTLPQSYIDFMNHIGSTYLINIDNDDAQLLAVEDIDYFNIKYPDLFNLLNSMDLGLVSDSEHENYTPSQNVVSYKTEYITDLIVISNQFDAGLLLLNPNVISSSGEWEAWFWGADFPGVIRFESFMHLIAYLSYIGLGNEHKYGEFINESAYENSCASILFESKQ